MNILQMCYAEALPQCRQEIRMLVGVLKETLAGERRVSAACDGQTLQNRLRSCGGVRAGVEASYPDSAYEAAGALIAPDAKAVWTEADIISKWASPV